MAQFSTASIEHARSPNKQVSESDVLDGDIPVKIGYEEQQEPESFFVPYSWDVTLSHTMHDIAWNFGAIDQVYGVYASRGSSEAS